MLASGGRGGIFVDNTYDWLKFYEAAVLETDDQVLPKRIQEAQYAIGQRVTRDPVDDNERRAIVHVLTLLGILKRERCGKGHAVGGD
jgi:hypothetical protein